MNTAGLGNMLRNHVVTGVGINAFAFGAHDWLDGIETVTTCMRKQLSKRSSVLSNFSIQTCGAVFNGDQRCPRGHHF